MTSKQSINFYLLPCLKITGGPLAIIEYAERFRKKGYEVTITTLGPRHWGREGSPFPWANYGGMISYMDKNNKRIIRKNNFNKNKKASKSPRNFIISRTEIKKTLISFSSFPKSIYSKFHKIDKLFLNIPYKFLRHFKLLKILNFFKNNYNHFIYNNDLSIENSINYQANIINMISNRRVLNSIDELIKATPDNINFNIATYWTTSYAAVLSAKGIPIYFAQHFEEIFYQDTHENLMVRNLCRGSYTLPIKIICNSSWLSNLLKENLNIKTEFSNNAIDINDFNIAPKLSKTDDIFRVITFTRPEPWKGFQDAFIAIKKFASEIDLPIEWNVFGYKPKNWDLFTDIPKNLNLKFHSGLSFKELSLLYAQCDVAYCPSWFESFPLPPLEAMASGTAVITTRYGTEDYCFNELNSLVINPRNFDEAKNALIRLFYNEDLRNKLAISGRKTAEGFSWENAVKKRLEIISSITKEDINKIIEPKINFDIYSKLLNYDHKFSEELLFNVDTNEYFLRLNQFVHKINHDIVFKQYSSLKPKNITSNELQPYIISNQIPNLNLLSKE